MNAFPKKLALFILPLAVLVSGTNIVVDPDSRYRFTYEEALAARLLMGQPAGMDRGVNDRALVRLLVQGRGRPARLVILGSSLSVSLTAENFCTVPDEVLNASVVGATIKDYLGVIWTLMDNDQLPENLLLEVSPVLLTAQPRAIAWQTLRREYEAMRIELESDTLPQSLTHSRTIEAARGLFSPSYFQESVDTLRRVGLDPGGWFVLEEDRIIRLPQGAIVLPESRMPSPDRVESQIDEYLRTHPAWPSPDEATVRVLGKLIQFLAAAGTQVSLYLPPIHPRVFVAERDNAPDHYGQYLAQVEWLAGRVDIDSVLASPDSSVFGLAPSAFRDGTHLRKPALDDYFTLIGCDWFVGE